MDKTKPPFDIVMLLIALLCGAMLMWLSILRYESYNAEMFDLGIMAQSMWTAAEKGLPLISTAPKYGARSRMHVHVEWIYYLFVPFYKLWSDPRLLLIGQALFFILGTIPVYRLALRHTQSIFAARCLSVIYLFYPVAQNSVLFDFHGDTLAMPILLFMLDALDRRKWWQYGFFTILALSCKMYVAAPVAMLGVCLLLWGKEMMLSNPHISRNNPLKQGDDMHIIRRVGIITLIGAMTYGAIAFLVIRPLFAPETSNFSETTGSYMRYYFGNIDRLLSTVDARLLSAFVVVAPVWLLAWRAKHWMLPGLLLMGIIITSSGPGAYGITSHHYALVVPFLMMATIVGTGKFIVWQSQHQTIDQENKEQTDRHRLTRFQLTSYRRTVVLVLCIVLLFHMGFVNTPLNPQFWMGIPYRGFDHRSYGSIPRDRLKDTFLATYIPPEVPVAVSSPLAPHVANRTTLYLIHYPDETKIVRLPRFLPQVDYLVIDALFEFYSLAYERDAITLALQHPDFHLVVARDGLLLFQQNATPEHILHQQVEQTPTQETIQSTPIANFGEVIDLLEVNIQHVKDRRFQATFVWTVPDRSLLQEEFVAVSRLDGTENARMVHIPTYALFPITEWQSGQVVTETFDVEIPEEIPSGHYQWKVGWYTLQEGHYNFATDERSRMIGSQEVIVTTIDVP